MQASSNGRKLSGRLSGTDPIMYVKVALPAGDLDFRRIEPSRASFHGSLDFNQLGDIWGTVDSATVCVGHHHYVQTVCMVWPHIFLSFYCILGVSSPPTLLLTCSIAVCKMIASGWTTSFYPLPLIPSAATEGGRRRLTFHSTPLSYSPSAALYFYTST